MATFISSQPAFSRFSNNYKICNTENPLIKSHKCNKNTQYIKNSFLKTLNTCVYRTINCFEFHCAEIADMTFI